MSSESLTKQKRLDVHSKNKNRCAIAALLLILSFILVHDTKPCSGSSDNPQAFDSHKPSAAPSGSPLTVEPQKEPGVNRCTNLRKIEETMHDNLRSWIDSGNLARCDGYIYGIDVSQALIYLAIAGDRQYYNALKSLVIKRFILADRSDPYTDGFARWRYKSDERLDASGTTEALRIAKGLWLGASAFGEASDRELSLKILRGYKRHAAEDQGIWLIRNYFNFGTRSFTTNSFTVDYDADFLKTVAGVQPEFSGIASKSYDLIAASLTPSGLVNAVVQPELKTVYPEQTEVVFYSPNDIIHLANSCTAAVTVTGGLPEAAGKVLEFAVARLDGLKTYYLGRSGKVADGLNPNAGIIELSCLARLAVSLNYTQAAAVITDHALPVFNFYLNNNNEHCSRPYAATEMLLAIRAVLLVDGGICQQIR